MMKSTFKIIPKQKLIVEILSKEISPDTYTKLKHGEFKDSEFNRHFNLVTDISSLNEETNKDTLQNIIEIFKENKGKINRKKSAIVVNNKNALKKIDLKVKQDKKAKSEIKVFTDIEKAEKWASR